MIHHRGTEGSSFGCTHDIVGAAIEVHRRLGPGLLESAYEMCLCRELNFQGIEFQQQVALPVQYRGLSLDCGYRLDILVEQSVIIEVWCKPHHQWLTVLWFADVTSVPLW
ncbi:MAG: GxxExxY protein [Gemmatimonadota bacterium]|nr:GxxExxY protein [Gemmatimonadota bacterium]